MSTDYAQTALAILKLAPRYLVSLGIIAALFLFLPDKVSLWLGIDEFSRHYRAWFSIVFLSTIVMFCVDRVIAFCVWMRYKQALKELKKTSLARLHRLTEDEKQILRFYFAKGTKANVLRFDDGVVQGLASAGIIYMSAPIGNMFEGFAYNISDFAWDYLHEHKELLAGTTNTSRTDKRSIFDM